MEFQEMSIGNTRYGKPQRILTKLKFNINPRIFY